MVTLLHRPGSVRSEAQVLLSPSLHLISLTEMTGGSGRSQNTVAPRFRGAELGTGVFHRPSALLIDCSQMLARSTAWNGRWCARERSAQLQVPAPKEKKERPRILAEIPDVAGETAGKLGLAKRKQTRNAYIEIVCSALATRALLSAPLLLAGRVRRPGPGYG